jgi:hypothetical protein
VSRPATSSLITAEVTMNGLIAAAGSSSKPTAFVFHFNRASGGPALNKLHIESAFQSAIATVVAAALNNRWAQTHNQVRMIDDALDPPQLVTRAVAGAIAGDSMSTLMTAYILMRTGIRGKNYRGSKHLAPLSESDTTAGTSDILNAGALTNFGNVATAIGAGFADSDGNAWTPVILSRSLSQLRTNPTTVITNVVTEIHVNKRMGRMKRREVASVY